MKEPKEQYKPVERLELKEIKTKVFQKVSCPSCEEEVSSDNLNLQNSLAKCGSCNVLFSIEEEVNKVKAKKEMKQAFLRPEGIDLFYYKDDLDITVQQHIQGLDVWGISLIPMIAAFTIGVFFLGEKPISPFIPIIFTLGAIYYIHKALTYSKFKTHIDVNDKFLSIQSRPKNLKKDRKYAANEIDQLYLKLSGDGMGYVTIFMIINGLEGQKHEKLLTVNTISKAKYLEQEIEKYLNIEDRKVPEATA